MKHDKRIELRYQWQETALIQLHDISSNGTYYECQTIDISQNGLQLNGNRPLSTGNLSDLVIYLNGLRYLITVESLWSEQCSNTEQYRWGFRIIEAEHSDWIDWQQLFAANKSLN